MRIQLAAPNHHILLGRQAFNQLFTMHGTTMVFLVGMPLIFGFANYLVPLMIGARDLAFPRLNAFGFWLSVFGGLLLYFSFIGGQGMTGAAVLRMSAGSLTRRSRPRHFPKDTARITGLWAYWSAASAPSPRPRNIITTILCMRCRGMTLTKMPLLAWLNLVMCGMVLIAVSPLTAAQIMLLLDRFAGSHFFDTQAGGSAVLWMHFFWIFGHPEVYVLIIPGFRVRFGNHPGLFAQGDLRLPGDGRSDLCDRLREPERLGASHVHGGHDLDRQYVLCHLDHDGRRADRHQNLQLDRARCGAENSASPRRCCSASRSSSNS